MADAYRSYLKAVALFQQWDMGDAATVTEPARLLEEAIRLELLAEDEFDALVRPERMVGRAGS